VKTNVRSRTVAAAFEARAERALLLAQDSSSAAEPLRFAARLLRAQGEAAAALALRHESAPFTGRFEIDVERAIAPLTVLVEEIARHAPRALADLAAGRLAEENSTVIQRLALVWRGDRPFADDYLSRAALRPYVESLRGFGVKPDREHSLGRCPFCSGPPIVGCRRGGTDDTGAARFLCCALCGLEWPTSRILCPSCFENDPHKLPFFHSDNHPAARIEACETCRRYVKSLDLSLDARPLPEVDDLASLSLDLWAIEQGFTRLEPGLAGV
jgi:FdhE protein